jgi:pimeloyl-ACP methyl ester carboxylesterase
VPRPGFAFVTSAALLLLSCASSASDPAPLRIRATETVKIRASGPTIAPELGPAPPAPGRPVDVEVPGAPPIVVAYAEDGVERALIYLHGACGDIRAPRAWTEVSSRYATLIAIKGDRRCDPDSDRTYWGPDIEQHEARIEAALERVADLRQREFAPKNLLIMGYSQGAQIVEERVRAHPDRYPRVILGGIPVPPSAEHLASARAVAVLGGERELSIHMKVGMWALAAKHIPARFALFPKAGHGDYGPEGPRVMDETLDWITRQ